MMDFARSCKLSNLPSLGKRQSLILCITFRITIKMSPCSKHIKIPWQLTYVHLINLFRMITVETHMFLNFFFKYQTEFSMKLNSIQLYYLSGMQLKLHPVFLEIFKIRVSSGIYWRDCSFGGDKI